MPSLFPFEWFGRSAASVSQAEETVVSTLSLASPPDQLLARRLHLLGLRPVKGLRTHTNRTVMVSLSPGGVLGIHRGYTHAPDRVLAAVVRFFAPGTRRETRLAARRELLSFPAHAYVPAEDTRRPRRRRSRPEDAEILARLVQLHESLNTRYFGGRLERIPIHLSDRMRSRLGELRLDPGRAMDITLSLHHLRRDPWRDVEQTLLHEMVHQWQAESGLDLDHGRGFRRKAVEVGIEPRARRKEVLREAVRSQR